MADQADVPFISSIAHHAADPFRLLIESVAEYAIFMLDPAGNVASWNPGAERIYGYRADEIVGRHVSCFCTGDDLANNVTADSIRRALEAGAHERECTRVRKDGSSFSAFVHLSKIKDHFGMHAGFAEVTRDVTEMKAAEAALRRERDLSAAILDSLPGVFYSFDQAGKFLRWNRQLEAVTGYSSGEIRQLHPLDLFEGEEKALLAKRIRNVFESGRGEVEAHFVSKSGTPTPYYFSSVSVNLEGQLCLIGMGFDITAHKKAEEELRATDHRLRLAAHAAKVGLWDWDLQTNEIYYSPEWKAQIGYADDEIGNSLDEWSSRVHPQDLDSAVKGMEAYIGSPLLPYASEFRFRHRDGSYRTILSQGDLIYDTQKRPIRMLGSHVDVTDQRNHQRRTEHSQKMEAIGQLAAGVAHDFNNILTVINGYSNLLLELVPPSGIVREHLLEIQKAGEHASTLTRHLLMFSRLQILEPKVLGLNAVVTDTGKILRRLLGPNVALATNLDPSLGYVMADLGHIEQVLINLLVNARDAMPDGGLVTIETHNVTLDAEYCHSFPDLPPGDYVLLTVSDTGCGMDEATQFRIFEPFFTTKAAGKGTGLGLATVHGIVKQSRGHIEVSSELGHGTVFKLYLPRVEISRVEADVPRHQVSMPSGAETVLLAEDDEAVRHMASFSLQSCGYRVLEAANGAEALQLAADHEGPIDLLIADVVMPHIGGRELAEQFILLRPECRVLYMSGYADDAVFRHGVTESEYSFLQKPFTPSCLAQEVRNTLDGSR